MSSSHYRKERIERLLDDLKFELTRAVMEREVEEHMGFSFLIPISSTYPKRGVVYVRMEMYPVENMGLLGMDPAARRLKIVGGKDE